MGQLRSVFFRLRGLSLPIHTRFLNVSPIGRWRGASLLIPSLSAKRFVVERLNQAVLAQDVAIYNLRWE